MKKVIFVLLVSLFVCSAAAAQTAAPAAPASSASTDVKPKRKVFRPTKAQIEEARKTLKARGLYSGTATGKLDDETRTAIKSFQKDNGLRESGTLNRATLEKLGIELTDSQKQIPVTDSSFAKSGDDSADAKPKRVIFRATKEQISETQKILRERSLYAGEQTGKLDEATREGLRKFQEAAGIKITGTLNQITLEKLGVELTDRQKQASEAAKK